MRIGCDIVDLSRVKPDLAKAILTKDELSAYLASPNKTEFLGGRFALKEAVMKALGLGMKAGFKNIEIKSEESGAIYASYQGRRLECSLSHDASLAFAVALDEG